MMGAINLKGGPVLSAPLMLSFVGQFPAAAALGNAPTT